jgi:regulator of ribonuclease activity A
MNFVTCDLCDANEDKLADGTLAILPPVFSGFGKRKKISGPAVTLKVFEDNALVRATLETDGNGRILIVDGGASLRCALVGGNLALLAERNGWAGIVVNGCIRDTDEIQACNIGVWGLAVFPKRSARKGAGDKGVRVDIQGIAIEPGDWIYADADGILVARQKLNEILYQ